MTLYRHHMPWTELEDARLQFLWGTADLQKVAEALGRTPHAVSRRAVHLKLGAPSRGAVSMNELSRRTGYSLCRLWTTIEHLGLTVHHKRRSEIIQKKRVRDFAVDEDQVDQIIEYLSGQPDGKRLMTRRADRQRTERGTWGCGVKPPACVKCDRNDKPHYAKGQCKSCYIRQFKVRSAA